MVVQRGHGVGLVVAGFLLRHLAAVSVGDAAVLEPVHVEPLRRSITPSRIAMHMDRCRALSMVLRSILDPRSRPVLPARRLSR